jgi:putative ABC transport system permease protein
VFVFTVVWITIKRIIHNWRIVTGILCGLVLATGIMSSIPIYSAGSLQKSFLKHWIEEDRFRPPLALIVSHENVYKETNVGFDDLLRLHQYLDRELAATFRSDLLSSANYARLGSNYVLPTEVAAPALLSPKGDLAQMSNLRQLGEIVIGRWYEPRDDGVIECVVDEVTFEKSELLIGETLNYWYAVKEGEVVGSVGRDRIENGYVKLTIELVGMFRPKAGYTTEQWIYPPPFVSRLFADPDVFMSSLLSDEGLGLQARNYDMQWVFDHSGIRVGDLPRYISAIERMEERSTRIAPKTTFWHSPLAYFVRFNSQRNRISVFLGSLGMPTLGMVLYYVMLLAGISVEHRKKEIIVMHSRGGGRAQVAVSFLLEWLILGAFAAIIGPALGLFIAKVMGTSAGFLSFTNRTSFPAAIGSQAVLFAVLGAAVAIAGGMLPVFGSVRQSIVTFTQRRDRLAKRSVWHRYFLDVLFLAAATYGYSRLSWETLRLDPGEQILAQPALFMVPVVMVIGAGVFLLRFYPYVIALLRWGSSKLPGVLWQLTFRRLTRSAGQYVPLMLLLIVTVSIGIYTAVAARTLSANFEDQIKYAIGADLATEEDWHPPNGSDYVSVSEPPFFRRLELPGVVSAARIKTIRADVRSSDQNGVRASVEVMAIEPYEFSRTAWFRNDFGEADFLEYLGLLARHREGVLVQTRVYEEAELELGQALTVVYKNQEIPVYVAGWIDFWPTLNPYNRPFVIMNLGHLQDYSALEPYNVWYRLGDLNDIENIVDSLAALGVYVTKLRDTATDLAEMRREPYRMGFYGLLSMGFIVSAIVTALGFFAFNFFSLRGRLVQFGALRAMGLTTGQLLGLIALEQMLTIGAGLGIGSVLGYFVSRLFIPLFRFRIADLNPVPPFAVSFERGDATLIVAIVVALFLVVLGVLSVALARMRVNQAIKLGEEV